MFDHTFECNLGGAAEWREILTHRETEVRPRVLKLATEFRDRHSLGLMFPRHDVMDHVLPFKSALGISHAEEVVADLVKLATLNLLTGESLSYPDAFLIESVLARKAENGYEYESEWPILRHAAPRAWESALQFYLTIGAQLTRQLWITACLIHYEVRGLPFKDDYFSGSPYVFGAPDNLERCG